VTGIQVLRLTEPQACGHTLVTVPVTGLGVAGALGTERGIKRAAPGVDPREMRLTLIAALSILTQLGAGQVRAQLWKLQDARER
jgi:hypothetical protein